MQTFVPFESHADSAAILDRRRLGKQRVECVQILDTLLGVSKGWRNHPAVKMWAGYEHELALYGLACVDEWVRRGYNDTRGPLLEQVLMATVPSGKPPWWGGPIHDSHKGALFNKAPEQYVEFERFAHLQTYVWPTLT